MKAIKELHNELRKSWREAKEAYESGRYKVNEEDLKAVQKVMPSMSHISFVLVKMQMEAQGLEGLPGLDMKTFQGWYKSGFSVKKGEKAKATGIVWMVVENKDNKEEEFTYPKKYLLFHTSQVQEIKKKVYK